MIFLNVSKLLIDNKYDTFIAEGVTSLIISIILQILLFPLKKLAHRDRNFIFRIISALISLGLIAITHY